LQTKIFRLLVRVKVVACLNDVIVAAREIFQQFARSPTSWPAVAARPAVGPIESPFQRTHDAIVVYRGELGFPVVHPLSVPRGHIYSRNTAMGRELATRVRSTAGFKRSAVSTQHSVVFRCAVMDQL